jgi:hypothetical protein
VAAFAVLASVVEGCVVLFSFFFFFSHLLSPSRRVSTLNARVERLRQAQATCESRRCRRRVSAQIRRTRVLVARTRCVHALRRLRRSRAQCRTAGCRRRVARQVKRLRRIRRNLRRCRTQRCRRRLMRSMHRRRSRHVRAARRLRRQPGGRRLLRRTCKKLRRDLRRCATRHCMRRVHRTIRRSCYGPRTVGSCMRYAVKVSWPVNVSPFISLSCRARSSGAARAAACWSGARCARATLPASPPPICSCSKWEPPMSSFSRS